MTINHNEFVSRAGNDLLIDRQTFPALFFSPRSCITLNCINKIKGCGKSLHSVRDHAGVHGLVLAGMYNQEKQVCILPVVSGHIAISDIAFEIVFPLMSVYNN